MPGLATPTLKEPSFPFQKITGDIPVDLPVENGNRFLFISNDQRKYTHGLHKYPAKFFPELPRWLIQRYSNIGDVILDPFMGSGTTNVEAILQQRDTIGVDVDVFSRFLSRVKTTPIAPSTLKTAHKNMLSYLSEPSISFSLPCFPYQEIWFNPVAFQELGQIKHGINTLYRRGKTRDFLLAVFSSIIRKMSQADNQCTRTVVRKNRPKIIEPGAPKRLFIKRLQDAITGMNEYTNAATSNSVIEIPERASATDLSMYNEGVIDAAITSPPYVNAVDYPRTHQLEMYWLDMASGSLKEHKARHIGTEVVSAQQYKELSLTGINSADHMIEKIYHIDPRRAYIAYKYLRDMILNFKEVYRVLKKGGYYVVVVGSNTIRNHIFENWRYLRDAADDIGYKIESVFISAIINHYITVPRKERINDDYILVLRK